jgi:tetratricopeptide (TPR) repeat protein
MKCGETFGTVLSSQQSILANLQKKLRLSVGVDALLSKRCIDKCGRLLLESTQDALRVEQFHSGPAARETLKKKLRLAECYCALGEIDAAAEISSEALEAVLDTFGRMNTLTLHLRRMTLYVQVRIHQRSSSRDAHDVIPQLNGLVEDHIEVFGPDHHETLGCRHDIALTHLIRREFTEARTILEPLHRRMVEILGRTSRVTQSVANNLAACANMQGEYDYAESILYTIPGLSKAAAEPLEIDITSVPLATLHALSILAAVLGARSEDKRSEILHQRVIDAFLVVAGPKSRRMYESAINKGQALRDQYKYTEARKHYLEWLKKSDQNFGPDSKHSREMRKRLIDLDHKERKWKEMSKSLKSPVVPGLPAWKKFPKFSAVALIVASVVAVFISIYFA